MIIGGLHTDNHSDFSFLQNPTLIMIIELDLICIGNAALERLAF
jgi:hypothetical protein